MGDKIGILQIEYIMRILLFLALYVSGACVAASSDPASEGLPTKSQDTFYFVVNPQDQDVKEGSEVRLSCDVSNRRNIEFHWTLNGRSLQDKTRRYQDGSDLVILRALRNEDAGSFHCIATNVTTGYSAKSSEARITVSWIDLPKPVQLKNPKEESQIVKDVTLTLKCNMQGEPEPSFEWYRNNNRMFSSDSGGRIRFRDGGRRLVVSNISSQDNGVYSCRAKNLVDVVESSDNLMVNLLNPNGANLVRSSFTKSVIVRHLDPVHLDCVYSNVLATEWYIGDRKIFNTSRRGFNTTVYPNGSLAINMVRKQDQDVYICVGVSAGLTQQFTSQLRIAFLDDMNAKSLEPRLSPLVPTVIPAGESYEVLCLPPDGLPQPGVKWLGPNDVEVPVTGRVRVEGTKLILQQGQSQDTGNYSCVVTNIAREVRRKVWLVVSVAPTITKAPSETWVEEGETATIECRVAGTPYPVTQIKWLKNNKLLEERSRFQINQRAGVLRIKNTNLNDGGEYSCTVNTTGFPVVMSGTATLHVKKKLRFRPKPINTRLELGTVGKIYCRADGDPKPNVRWLKDGESIFPSHISDQGGILIFSAVEQRDVGFYTCLASSIQGTINATIYVTVGVKPKFTVKPENVTAAEGKSVLLKCAATGDPIPMLSWDKNSRVTDLDKLDRFQTLVNGSLSISQVQRNDAGRYGCTAGNSGGLLRMEMYLQVVLPNGDIVSTGVDPVSPGVDPLEVEGSGGTDGDDGEDGDGMMKTIIIAVVCAVAYLALVIGLTVFCSLRMIRKKRMKNKEEQAKTENGDVKSPESEKLMGGNQSRSSQSHRSEDVQSNSRLSGVSSHPTSHSSHSHRSRQRASYDNLKFPRHDLQTVGMLGKGEFGDVFLAKALGIKDGEKETLVVVKSLLNKDETSQYEFLQEIDMFSKLNSDYVVHVLGVCKDTDPQFMMTEYLEWGDLKQFLQASRKDNGKHMKIPPLSIAQKVSICSQVALGMEHIANKRFVHRDLAARNVLLSPDLNIKVANLGLCRDFYKAEYYRYHDSLIPIRWMPPEAVLDEDYSTKSDVWAYGIFIWEVFTLGELPFKNFSNEQILDGMKRGVHQEPDPLQHCPDEIQSLMIQCWNESLKDRPSFAELVVRIGEMTVDSDV